jgi:hypothetical protein
MIEIRGAIIAVTKPEENIKSLFIAGRRWFARTYGNTYHKVDVTVNGETVTSEETYGYNDHYLQTAHELLQKMGLFVNYTYSDFYWWLREHKEIAAYTVSDVGRERDL